VQINLHRITVTPNKFLTSKFAFVSQIFVFVELRIVHISLTSIAPDRQVTEAQSQWMFARLEVSATVLVDVTRAENLEANQTNPILDLCLTICALAIVIKF
jgi:hypothetical protein